MIFPQESEDLHAKSRDLIIYEGNGLGKEVVFFIGRGEFAEGISGRRGVFVRKSETGISMNL